MQLMFNPADYREFDKVDTEHKDTVNDLKTIIFCRQ